MDKPGGELQDPVAERCADCSVWLARSLSLGDLWLGRRPFYPSFDWK